MFHTHFFKPVVLKKRLWPLLVVPPVAASEPLPARVSLGKLKPDAVLSGHSGVSVVWRDPDRQVGRRRGGAQLNGADTLKQPFEMACFLFGNRECLFCVP